MPAATNGSFRRTLNACPRRVSTASPSASRSVSISCLTSSVVLLAIGHQRVGGKAGFRDRLLWQRRGAGGDGVSREADERRRGHEQDEADDEQCGPQRD